MNLDLLVDARFYLFLVLGRSRGSMGEWEYRHTGMQVYVHDHKFEKKKNTTKVKVMYDSFIKIIMASYTTAVAGIHRQFQSALKKAKSRQAVLNAYWAHKKAHERLLRQHLREEMNQVKRIKDKMDYS